MTTTPAPTKSLIAGQLDTDKYLYVWTAHHAAKLNRRNRLTSPPLEIPDTVKTDLGHSNLQSIKVVLLRGVVKAQDEQDDPVGVFLQVQFAEDAATTAVFTPLKCKVSISCTPVRSNGHSHSAGPEDFEFLSAADSLKGIKSLLPAAALKIAPPPSNNTASNNDDDNDQQHTQTQQQQQLSPEDKAFLESSPVEVQITIQFLPAVKFDTATATTATTKTTSSTTSITDQAASLFGGLTATATSTLGSWWSTAATAVSTSKITERVAEKVQGQVLPQMKAALSTAAERAESLAHQIMEQRKESKSNSKTNSKNNTGTTTSNTTNNGKDAAAAAVDGVKAPWDEIPPSYRNSGGTNDLTPERWRNLLLTTMVEEESVFLWAPESAYGVHHRQKPQSSSPSADTHDSIGSSIAAATASTPAAAENSATTTTTTSSLSPSRISQLRPQYPDYTFEPEEELLLSRCGLSANLLLHCNDGFNFDTDVEPHFVDGNKHNGTAALRQMRLHLVPRVVSEERFWAAFLWRVACLALCTTVEQEAIVKSLLRKPVVPVVRAPKIAAGAGALGDEHENDDDDDVDKAKSIEKNGKNSRSASPQGRGENAEIAEFKKKLAAVPDISALSQDVDNALELLNEVCDEAENDSNSDSGALFVASLRGAERCLRNAEEGIAAIDALLDDDRAGEQWRKTAEERDRPTLVALRDKVKAALQRAAQVQQQQQQKQKQQPKQQQKVEPATTTTSVTSPSPRQPASPVAGGASSTTSSASPVAAKSKTPVLMPWEEEDD